MVTIFVVFAIPAALFLFVGVLAIAADEDECAVSSLFVGLFFCMLAAVSTLFLPAPLKEIPAHTSTIESYTFVAEPLVWIEKETLESLEP